MRTSRMGGELVVEPPGPSNERPESLLLSESNVGVEPEIGGESKERPQLYFSEAVVVPPEPEAPEKDAPEFDSESESCLGEFRERPRLYFLDCSEAVVVPPEPEASESEVPELDSESERCLGELRERPRLDFPEALVVSPEKECPESDA